MKAHRRCVYAACWDQVWPPRVPNIRVLESKQILPTSPRPPHPWGAPWASVPVSLVGQRGDAQGGVCVCCLVLRSTTTLPGGNLSVENFQILLG